MEPGRLERRSSERFRTDLKGRIRGDEGSPAVDCIMRDLSTTGARLVFSDPAEIPLEFELEIPEEEATAKVRLIWGTGRQYGVVFTD